MSMFDQLKQAAEAKLSENPELVEKVSDTVIEKAGDLVDDRTGGKYADKIDLAQGKADEAIGS
ncbi:MAG: antitoxin [Kineosporiaceae bacterium]